MVSKAKHPDEKAGLKFAKQIYKPGDKSHGRGERDPYIRSAGTFRSAIQAFKLVSRFCRAYGFKSERLSTLTVDTAEKYLEHRATVIQQKQLNVERNLLDKHLSNIHKSPMQIPMKISHRESSTPSNRSYSHDEIKQLCAAAIAKGDRPLAVAIQVAYQGGLRAAELHSLRPQSEWKVATHREWRQDLYSGRDHWHETSLPGKGGLDRQVRVTESVIAILEREFRLPEPYKYRDPGRKTDCQKYYSLPGGQDFSQRFGDLSREIFGWSRGAHGLRHSFARARMVELKNQFSVVEAKKILAQELGHFSTGNLRYYQAN